MSVVYVNVYGFKGQFLERARPHVSLDSAENGATYGMGLNEYFWDFKRRELHISGHWHRPPVGMRKEPKL